MRFPELFISPTRPQMVLLMWLLKTLLFPVGEIMGAPTTTSTTARPSRGDRVPPPESIYVESFILPGDGGRTRREAGELSVELAEEATVETETVAATTEGGPQNDDAEVMRSARLISREPYRPVSGNSSPGSRTVSRIAEQHLDDGFYYYHYHDSFVEGVTTRDDLEDYPEHGAPVDLEDSNDDNDNGEIMELLNLATKMKNS